MSARVANPAILVVDDDPEILNLLWTIINSMATGYTILTCTHGDMALEQAMQQPTPLLITDYNLPGMNGLQLTAALKARAAPLGGLRCRWCVTFGRAIASR